MDFKEKRQNNISTGPTNIFIPIKDLIKTNPTIIDKPSEQPKKQDNPSKEVEKEKHQNSSEKWNDNKDARTVFDNQISERAYVDVTEKVVNASIDQLSNQFESKRKLKSALSKFFIAFITAQYIFLVVLLLIKAFWVPNYSETIILSYITSVFLETLGAIIIMVTHSFASKEEVKILKILSDVFSSFQK